MSQANKQTAKIQVWAQRTSNGIWTLLEEEPREVDNTEDSVEGGWTLIKISEKLLWQQGGEEGSQAKVQFANNCE